MVATRKMRIATKTRTPLNAASGAYLKVPEATSTIAAMNAMAKRPESCDRPPDSRTTAVRGGLALTANAPKNAAKMKAKIGSLREKVTQLLDESSGLGARVSKAEEAEKTIEPAMVDLRQAVPNYVKIFDTIFPAAVSIGLGAASGGLEIAHAEGVIEVAKGSLEIANEVLDSAREALEG